MKFKVSKSLIIEISIVIIFLFFLLSLIPEDNIDNSNEFIKEFGESSDEALQVKYSVINEKVTPELNNTKIGYINNKYLSELIVNKKISNRENSIAQELISMYNKNLTEEIILLSNELINPILDEFDTRPARRWTNYVFCFEKDDIKFTFYNQSFLLKQFNESKIKNSYSFKIRPYLYERYYFELENGTTRIVDINLLNYEGEEELSKYVNIDTYEPIVPIRDINSEFIESDNEYNFNLYIWS